MPKKYTHGLAREESRRAVERDILAMLKKHGQDLGVTHKVHYVEKGVIWKLTKIWGLGSETTGGLVSN